MVRTGTVAVIGTDAVTIAEEAVTVSGAGAVTIAGPLPVTGAADTAAETGTVTGGTDTVTVVYCCQSHQ